MTEIAVNPPPPDKPRVALPGEIAALVKTAPGPFRGIDPVRQPVPTRPAPPVWPPYPTDKQTREILARTPKLPPHEAINPPYPTPTETATMLAKTPSLPPQENDPSYPTTERMQKLLPHPASLPPVEPPEPPYPTDEETRKTLKAMLQAKQNQLPPNPDADQPSSDPDQSPVLAVQEPGRLAQMSTNARLKLAALGVGSIGLGLGAATGEELGMGSAKGAALALAAETVVAGGTLLTRKIHNRRQRGDRPASATDPEPAAPDQLQPTEGYYLTDPFGELYRIDHSDPDRTLLISFRTQKAISVSTALLSEENGWANYISPQDNGATVPPKEEAQVPDVAPIAHPQGNEEHSSPFVAYEPRQTPPGADTAPANPAGTTAQADTVTAVPPPRAETQKDDAEIPLAYQEFDKWLRTTDVDALQKAVDVGNLDAQQAQAIRLILQGAAVVPYVINLTFARHAVNQPGLLPENQTNLTTYIAEQQRLRDKAAAQEAQIPTNTNGLPQRTPQEPPTALKDGIHLPPDN